MKNILIVEDEMLIASLLKKHIEKAGYNCVGIATDYYEAITILKKQVVDFVFLDITISGQKSGLDIAKYINKTAPLPFIFLTSHSDIRTIAEVTKTKPAGYLSKPFKEIDVTLALNIYFQNEPQTESLFKLNIGKNNYFLDLASIQYVETNHVYSNIVMSEKKILIRTPLSNLIDLLPAGSLIRVNRSTAVNTKYMTSISNNHIHLQNKEFKLSSVYYDEYKHLNHEL